MMVAGSKTKLAAPVSPRWRSLGRCCRGCRRRRICWSSLVTGYRRRGLAGAPQFDSGRSPDFKRLFVQVGHISRPDDVRNQGKDNFVFLVLDVALRKQIFQDGDLGQSWNTAQRSNVLIFQNSAEDIYFAFLEANFVFDLALANDRLADPADIRLPGHRGNIHRDFQSDFAAGVHLGGDIDIYADVEILKLRVYQGVNTDAADAGLERASSHRHAIADLERCLLSIDGANLRVLNQLGGGVTEQRRGCRRRDGDRKVSRVQVAQPVQVDLIRGSRGSRTGGSRGACRGGA